MQHTHTKDSEREIEKTPCKSVKYKKCIKQHKNKREKTKQ